MTKTMQCPRTDCEGEITVEVTNVSRGWPGNYWSPAEPDELEWVVSKPCAVCGMDDDYAVQHHMDDIELVLWEAFEEAIDDDEDRYWQQAIDRFLGK